MGPLEGVKVIEIAGIGPGPFAAMLLADMGADVVRVDRTQGVVGDFSKPNLEVLNRGRRSIGVDLKHADGVETVLRSSTGATRSSRASAPAWPSASGSGPTPVSPATRSWSTAA